MILGCDAAGLDEDGNEVVVHAVISDPAWTGDETLDPKRSLLSERHQGTFADQVVVPRGNVVPKPASLSLRGGRLPADRLADGLPDALHPGRPQGRRHRAGAGRRRRRRHRADHARARRRAHGCWPPAATRPSAPRALEIGAHEVFESGARLPVKVDAVMETVGRATWSHSIRSLRPGGTIVISGTTQRPEARRRRADPDLLPPAAGDRLDDGHPRRAGLAGQPARRHRHPAADRPHAADGPTPATASPRWPTATCSARSSSPAEGRA